MLGPKHFIPFNNLGKTFDTHKDKIFDLWNEVGMTGQFAGGLNTKAFEDLCALQSSRYYGIAVANATDGLYFALLAMGIDEDAEVLVPAYSYHATAEAIAKTGATPVFVDVDEYYHMELIRAEQLVTEKTKALVFVNLFGDMMDVKKLKAFASKHNLLILEDAAQSYGSEFNNLPSGCFGDASVFSFDATKQLPGMGHGGCVVTNYPYIEEKVRMLALHGKHTDGKHYMLGHKSTISEFEAAQLVYFLENKDTFIKPRIAIAEFYNRHIWNPLIAKPLTRETTTTHSWSKYVIRCDRRDDLREHLRHAGVETQIHYKRLAPYEPVFGGLGGVTERILFLPYSYAYSQTSLSLPIYPELEMEDLWCVTEALNSFR